MADYSKFTNANGDDLVLQDSRIPSFTSEDSGKVLSIDSTGNAIWNNSSGGGKPVITTIKGLLYKKDNYERAGYIIDKTMEEILSAYNAGEVLEIYLIPVDYTPTTEDIVTEWNKPEAQYIVMQFKFDTYKLYEEQNTIYISFISQGQNGFSFSMPPESPYSAFIPAMIWSTIKLDLYFDISTSTSSYGLYLYPNEIGIEKYGYVNDPSEPFYVNTWDDFEYLIWYYYDKRSHNITFTIKSDNSVTKDIILPLTEFLVDSTATKKFVTFSRMELLDSGICEHKLTISPVDDGSGKIIAQGNYTSNTITIPQNT